LFTAGALEEIATAVAEKLAPLMRVDGGKPWPALTVSAQAHAQ
jgi:hypothetical protein